jgi:hypothetical protein
VYTRIAGVAVALGATVLVAKFWRPIAKSVVKGYLSVTDHLREYAAEGTEGIQDLYAEAKSEHERAKEAAAACAEAPVEELSPQPARVPKRRAPKAEAATEPTAQPA